MKHFLRIVMIALAVIVLNAQISPATPTEAQSNRQTWAYYFGWYTGDSWGDGRLVDRPAALYDSRDAGALGGHIDQAKSAGIDAFIMSYYGPKNNNLTHQVFNALLDQANARGFKIGASVDLGDPSYNGTVDEVKETLRYLINDRVNHGAYVRYSDKPVNFFWNQGRFSVSQWQAIRNEIDPNHNTIWVSEGTSTAYIPTFDGLYLFNVAWSRNPATTAQSFLNSTVNAGGTFYSATVMPAWDESRIEGRDNPTNPQDRADGQFLTNSWNGAASSDASVILIVSWNEYVENSYIEPSQNHGSQALDILRPLIAAWESGDSSSTIAPVSGNVFTTTANLNVRAAPSTDADILTTIPYRTAVQAVGRLADNSWVQVQFNGQTGWVSAAYGTLNVDVNTLPVTG